MEELLSAVAPIPDFVDPPTPTLFRYHTGDEVPLQTLPNPDLFDLQNLGAYPIELLLPPSGGDLHLLVFADDDSEENEDGDEDDQVYVDVENIDYMETPTRHTWLMHLHDGALIPVTSSDGFSFPRGTLRTVMLEFRVDRKHTVQIHLTGVVDTKGDHANDPVLAAIISRAERSSLDGLREVVFLGDVMFTGALSDESLMTLSKVHTAASEAARRLRPKRGGK